MLKQLGDEAVVILEGSRVFATLDGLESDLADGRPELVVEVDREKAALYGLNTRDIDFTIRSVINGTEASKYRDGNDEYDITVRLAEEYREDLNNLGDLNVVSDGRQVPLPSVASWSVGTGFSDVRRKDLDRVVTRGSHLSLPTLFPYNLVVTITRYRSSGGGITNVRPPVTIAGVPTRLVNPRPSWPSPLPPQQ